MSKIAVKCVHTRTKKLVDLNDVKPEDIDLDDIAWSLAGMNRWCAHGSMPYFVTDHLQLVENLMLCDKQRGKNHATPIDSVWALLHDAHEAYTNDIPGPLKYYIAQFTDALSHVEKRIDRAVARHFLLDQIPYNESMIHEYDMKAREVEYEALFNGNHGSSIYWGDRTSQATRAKQFKETFGRAMDNLRVWCADNGVYTDKEKTAEPAMASPVTVTVTLTEDQVAELRKALNKERYEFKIGPGFAVVK